MSDAVSLLPPIWASISSRNNVGRHASTTRANAAPDIPVENPGRHDNGFSTPIKVVLPHSFSGDERPAGATTYYSNWSSICVANPSFWAPVPPLVACSAGAR